MSLKILATGDIHIGRRPSRVPDEIDAARFSCANMWDAIVEEAITRKVDLLGLSGDVVDAKNCYFEAIGPLERGLRRLADARIPTYAVAGNHDWDVLPRIVKAVDPEYFHLLGHGGRWEQATLERDGKPLLHVHGWSFPAGHASTSPLVDYRLPIDDFVPTLGLLHADLDASGSRYAPVSKAELRQHNLAFWLLGHVHKPQFTEDAAGPAILYPGSPQAMDPGETGVHGPWLIEVDGARSIEAHQIPLSKVCYDKIPIDLDGVADTDAAQHAITQQVGQSLADTAQRVGPAELLLARLELTGQTTACQEISRLKPRIITDTDRSFGRLTLRIEDVTNNTRPLVDLKALAEKHDPPGVLARTLLALESNGHDEAIDRLLRAARDKMLEAHRAPGYSPISGDDERYLNLDAARATLLQQGVLLLETLRAQEQTS